MRASGGYSERQRTQPTAGRRCALAYRDRAHPRLSLQRLNAMTLIHSEITSRWALQVSDRLLTVASSSGAQPFDSRSNKTVVLHARDAIVTLSYTGLAYLQDTPTDAWIAHKLNGTQFPFNPKAVDFTMRLGMRRSEWPALGCALSQLAAALTQAASLPRSDLRRSSITVAVAGWLWYRRKRPRAVLATVGKVGSDEFGVKWAPRRHGKYFLHLIAPNGYLSDFERQEVHARLAGADLEDATAIFASSIRRVAARTDTVGADCMSVSISHPWMDERTINARFLPNLGEVAEKPRTSPRFAAYSPWVVGPHQCLAPMLLVGAGGQFNVGQYRLVLSGPQPEYRPPHPIGALFAPQPRKRFRSSG